ncbi:MAG TPA: hypothetical protein VGO07_01120 [Candidatus Saccharimonadales bacterium]|nr:hypothetical protein [Candidatus Saccharimonadales bacterium]
MNMVKTYPLDSKYRKQNGLFVVDAVQLPIPDDFEVHEQSVVYIPPGQVAGNHTHPRQEAYICCDEGAELHWMDESGEEHIEVMGADRDGGPTLFVVESMVAHAVVNTSGHGISLFGYADGPFEDVVGSVVVSKPGASAGPELSGQEAVTVATLLSKLQPGFLPFVIFHQLARLLPMPVVEVVPLRTTGNGKVEILLLNREADDPIWPGKLHVPGTVIRATDTEYSFESALRRVIHDEMADTEVSEPVFVETMLHRSLRGMEVGQIFWLDVRGNPKQGAFYDVNNLPDSLIAAQLGFIQAAIVHYKKTKA